MKIEDLDAENRGAGGGVFQDFLLELHTAKSDLVASLFESGRDLELAVGGAHDLDQIVIGDGVAGLPVENIVEAALSAALVTKALEEQQGVGNAPSSIGVNVDEPLVLGGYLIGLTVPLEEAFFEEVRLLDEGGLDLEAGRHDGLTDRFAELCDDDLLCLIDDEEGATDRGDCKQNEYGDQEERYLFHGFTSVPPNWRSGKTPSKLLSSRILRSIAG